MAQAKVADEELAELVRRVAEAAPPSYAGTYAPTSRLSRTRTTTR